LAASGGRSTGTLGVSVEALQYFPFCTLKLSPEEQAVWYGYNPTFHRFLDYGLVLSNRAVYLCSRSWWRFAHWRRVPLQDILNARVVGGRLRPELSIETPRGTVRLTTPYDTHRDEMELDAKVLEQAVVAIDEAISRGKRLHDT
jgi:hypothetical protein